MSYQKIINKFLEKIKQNTVQKEEKKRNAKDRYRTKNSKTKQNNIKQESNS